MSTNTSLLSHADAELRGLSRQYNLHLATVRKPSHADQVTLQNATTAVRILVDKHENRLFVNLFRLHGQELPAIWDINARMQDPLNGFDADDLVALRAPSSGIVQNPAGPRLTEPAVRQILRQYGTILPKVADDVLKGDFAVFRELANVVMLRIDQAIQKGYPEGPEYEAFRTAYRKTDGA